MTREIQSWAEFWPFYLREHSKPRTRALHYAGTTLVVALLVLVLVTGRGLWLLAIPGAG
ncbi:MAG: Mpo1-like protein, partial [Sphingomicrobium sp.]